MTPNEPRAAARWPRWAAVLALTAAAAALRAAKLPELSLAYDGIQSVTHAGRPFPLSLLSALLSDPHPPLYYALLSAWMRLFPSDAGILAFSVLASAALVPSLYYVGRRLYGERVGLFAALVGALHPLALFWSHYARMYALVMLLALWAFYANARLLSGPRPEQPGSRRETRRRAAAVVVLELCLIYSHVAAPFALLFVYAWAAARRFGGPGGWRRFAAPHAVVLLLALPYLFFPLTTGQAHMRRPGAGDVVEALSLFVNGMQQPDGFVVGVSAAVFAAAAALLLARRSSRAFAACFLVAPFAAAAAVSWAVKPIWYGPRTFAFLVPFSALAFARLAFDEGGRGRASPWARGTALLALALVSRGAVGYTLHYEKTQRFVDAAQLVRSEARAGDLVLVPTLKDKWAFSRYFVGADWDRALWTDSTAALWSRAASRDGRRDLARRVGGFGRDPEGLAIEVLPADRREALPPAARVWVVARNVRHRDELVRRFALGDPRERWRVPGVDVALFGPPGAAP